MPTMPRTVLTLTPLVLVVAAAGCSPTTDPPVTAMVHVGPMVTFQVEVAETAEQQRAGLTGRVPTAGSGMLFRFGTHTEHQVWMAGMTTPLDIAWISDNTVQAIDTLTPCTTPDQGQCPSWTSPTAVDALLEVPGGALSTVIPGMTVIVEELP